MIGSRDLYHATYGITSMTPLTFYFPGEFSRKGCQCKCRIIHTILSTVIEILEVYIISPFPPAEFHLCILDCLFFFLFEFEGFHVLRINVSNNHRM